MSLYVPPAGVGVGVQGIGVLCTKAMLKILGPFYYVYLCIVSMSCYVMFFQFLNDLNVIISYFNVML